MKACDYHACARLTATVWFSVTFDIDGRFQRRRAGSLEEMLPVGMRLAS